DLGDANEREIVAIAAPPARILAAALLEHDHLVAALVRDHLGGDERAGDRRLAEGGFIAADDHHREGDDLAGLGPELAEAERLVLGDRVLLAARLDDREHRRIPCFFWRGRAALNKVRGAGPALSPGLWRGRRGLSRNEAALAPFVKAGHDEKEQ